MSTIHTAQHLGHWSAWFEDHPEVSFSGDTAATATARLLEYHGMAYRDPRLRKRESQAQTERCPDCDGSGRYVGLTTVGVCEACRGSGRKQSPARADEPMPDEYDVEAVIAEYRRVITERDALPTKAVAWHKLDGRARYFRDEWKAWQGEDSLHEMAFGEPVEE